MNDALGELKRRLAEVTDLRLTAWLLEWDQEILMPRGGAPVRAEQLATLERIIHERATSDDLGRLLEQLRVTEEELDYDSDDASLIRVARRDWEKARRVPAALQEDMARAAVEGYQVWVLARQESDYGRFRPVLERNLELRRRYIECFDDLDDPYDVLLDDFEPGMKTAEAAAVLGRLRDELPPLVALAREAGGVDASFLEGPFTLPGQQRVERALLEAVGFEPEHWRLNVAVHPMAYGFGPGDIRISTRYSETSLESVFSALHEFGHGLYERQVDPALTRTPLGGGVSLGMHESQSRLWENLVGRGLPFWRRFYAVLQQEFPDRLGDVDLERFHRAVNRVEPSLIRVDADEVTYNLHIVLRFELERELLAGSVSLAELPEAWNARMHELLGVDVPDDAHGVLQDVHWAGGNLGYFSTYSLGNVISAQLWEAVTRALPAVEEEIEAGEFGGLREWLRERVHRHGRKFTPLETLDRAIGEPIDPEPYLRYLRAKVEAIHGVPAGP